MTSQIIRSITDLMVTHFSIYPDNNKFEDFTFLKRFLIPVVKDS